MDPAKWAIDESDVITRSRHYANDGRGIHEGSAVLVQAMQKEIASKLPATWANWYGAGVFLQADQSHAWHSCQRLEPCEGNGAMPVDRIGRVALPVDSDFEPRDFREA